MTRVFLHVKRLFKKFWLLIVLAFCGSPLVGLPIFLIMLAISLLFFNDPVEPISRKDLQKTFSEDELAIIDDCTVNESVTDDEYFTLLARIQCFICPKRINAVTTWNGSEVTKDAYIYHYKIDERNILHNTHFEEELKKQILSEADPKEVRILRLIRSNRNLIYRYWYSSTEGYAEIVITPTELKNRFAM